MAAAVNADSPPPPSSSSSSSSSSSRAPFVDVAGSCHCGAVAFRARVRCDGADNRLCVRECNCSICARMAFEHVICPRAAFVVERGDDVLTTYTFGTHVARHTFCSRCGCKPFYTPRSNPDGVSINFRCLTSRPADADVERSVFDGQNWERNAASLAHLSKARVDDDVGGGGGGGGGAAPSNK